MYSGGIPGTIAGSRVFNRTVNEARERDARGFFRKLLVSVRIDVCVKSNTTLFY